MKKQKEVKKGKKEEKEREREMIIPVCNQCGCSIVCPVDLNNLEFPVGV